MKFRKETNLLTVGTTSNTPLVQIHFEHIVLLHATIVLQLSLYGLEPSFHNNWLPTALGASSGEYSFIGIIEQFQLSSVLKS